jgi:phospholipase C
MTLTRMLRLSLMAGSLTALVGCSGQQTPLADGGPDAGTDAGLDGGGDAGTDGGADAGPLQMIQHVFIIFQENRSLDNYFGT